MCSPVLCAIFGSKHMLATWLGYACYQSLCFSLLRNLMLGRAIKKRGARAPLSDGPRPSGSSHSAGNRSADSTRRHERAPKRKPDTRSRQGRKQNRQGRKQNRQGRKQNRQGRKQNRDRRHRKTLRVLNVQRPWARLLLTGAKQVEVRKYPLKNYMDEDLWVLETKGERAPRDFASGIIGIIRFWRDFEYQDLQTFRADEHQHRILKGSSFDWQPSKTPRLHGWVVASASLLAHSLPPPKAKGMIGAKATSRRATLPK